MGNEVAFTTTLEQLTGTAIGAGNQNILSVPPRQHTSSIITTDSSVAGVTFTSGGQQTLHHVDPTSISFQSQPQSHELLRQQSVGSISHSNTVIIQQPLIEDVVTTTTTNLSGTTATTFLETQGNQFGNHPQLQHVNLDQSQQQQLIVSDGNRAGAQTAANLQHQMVHHVLVDPSTVDHVGTGGVSSPVFQSDPSQYCSTSAALEGAGAEGGVVFSLNSGLPSTTSTYT